MHADRRSLDRAVIALAQEPEGRRDDLEAVIAAAPERLGRLVIEHRIAGVAYHHARHLTDRYPALLAQLDRARKETWSRHLVMMADLRVVTGALADLDAPWALVKGPVLALRAYGAPDRRSYFDLDVLVHPSAYGAALGRLEAAGAVLLDRNWELIGTAMRAQLSLLVNDRTPIDLHWHLLNERDLRQRTRWDMTALLERAPTADLDGLAIRVLEPADALVHLATHACLSGAHRMVWLKDLERQSATFPVAPEQVEARARDARLWPHVSLALHRAAATLEVAAPGRLPAWGQVNRTYGFGRFHAERGTFGTGRALGAATRPTVLGSVAAATRIVAGHTSAVHAERRARRRRLPPPGPAWELLRTDAGSDADRKAYLDKVAAG